VRRLDGNLTLAQKGDGFRRGGECRCDLAGVGGRLEGPEMSLALRGLREAADDLDNAVEFKGPEGASVHAID
jgi:hypothetical protein